MRKKKRQYTSEFKLKAVLEILKKEKTSARPPHKGTLGICHDLCYKRLKRKRSLMMSYEELTVCFFNGRYRERKNYEANKFNPKNCLDIGVHHILS